MKKPILREEPGKWRGESAAAAKRPPKARKPVPSVVHEELGSSTITAKGQTTIPKKVRDRLGLRPGSRLDFELGSDGIVRLRGASVPLSSLFGILGKPKRNLTIEQINMATAEMWSRRR